MHRLSRQVKAARGYFLAVSTVEQQLIVRRAARRSADCFAIFEFSGSRDDLLFWPIPARPFGFLKPHFQLRRLYPSRNVSDA